MRCHVEPGLYVAAVSGGVDSMVMLDVVRQIPGVRLVVAHVNHGMREDATEDAKTVRVFAMSHNLPYEETTLRLGKSVGEDKARQARYDFLRRVSKKYNALAILTAHHKDDVIETAIINMLRGTGWRGLSSLRSTGDIVRPLLSVSKADLVRYASAHAIPWRHDSTNDDTGYMRNYVRRVLLPKIPPQEIQRLYRYIVRQNELTALIDCEIAKQLNHYVWADNSSAALPRYLLIMLPENVAHELLQGVLRQTDSSSIVRPLMRRALLFVKVAKPYKTFPINARWQLRSLPREVIVEPRPAVLS